MAFISENFNRRCRTGIIAQLKAVSDQWLRIPGRRERSFTLGQFDPDYLRSKPVLVVMDSAAEPCLPLST